MASTFQLTIRTPDSDVFVGDVKSLTFESEGKGTMQVLAHHATITTTLSFSSLKLELDNLTENFLARNGLFMFDNENNSAVLLVLHCEKRENIDYKTASEYLAFINDRLKKGETLSDFQIVYLKGEKIALEKQMQIVKNDKQ